MDRRGRTSRWPRRLLASGVGGMVLVGVEYYLLGSLAYDATASTITSDGKQKPANADRATGAG